MDKKISDKILDDLVEIAGQVQAKRINDDFYSYLYQEKVESYLDVNTIKKLRGLNANR